MTRRDFLRVAGVTAATIGVAGTFGAGLAACGSESTDTTAGDTTTTSGGATSTTASPATTGTSAAAGAEKGRAVKLGVVTPRTGGLAIFGQADDWWIGHAKDAVKGGIVLGDGKQHEFEIEVQDTQSDSNRASQVAGDLVMTGKVDILIAGGSPDTVDPAADQAEALGVPLVASFSPWQTFWFNRKAPAEGFKWTYGFMLGSEQAIDCFLGCYDQVPNNKIVGMLFANDADAQGWMDEKTGAPAVFKAAGYQLVVPAFYTPGAEDFTQQIAEFKSKGCEILCGTNNAAEFTNFWKQALQQGFNPKLASSGKCLGWPSVLEAIGPSGYGLLAEIGWHPTWPFKDSITGQTCQELADDYEAKTGRQWVTPIGSYAKFEWIVDALKRTKDIEDKNAIVQAIASTKLETIEGLIDFTSPVDMASAHPVPNVYKQPFCAGQWVKGTKYAFDVNLVDNAQASAVTIDHTVQPMQYS
jgi:branched-chain amino acid transport system substrate-binding protein